MKQITYLLLLLLFSCTGFSQTDSKQNTDDGKQSPKMYVYFFHGTHRCTGCINAEKATVTVLNSLYKTELANGTIVFESVNIEEEKNKALAEKYEVAWNLLLFVKNDGSGTKKELTQQAFAYGSDPDGLKPVVKATVDDMLK